MMMETNVHPLCPHCRQAVRPLEDVATGEAVCPQCAHYMGQSFRQPMRLPPAPRGHVPGNHESRFVFSTQPLVPPWPPVRRALPIPRPATPGDSLSGVSSSAWLPDAEPGPSLDLVPGATGQGRESSLAQAGWWGLPWAYYVSAGAIIAVLLLIIGVLLLN